jgi:hypothetical protein
MTLNEDRERRLAANAVGLFIDAVSGIDPSPAAVAHALWLLIEEAKRRRERCWRTKDQNRGP